MRIATITSGHIPSAWAHSINFVRQASAFQRIGHDVTVYSVLREQESAAVEGEDLSEFYGIEAVKFAFEKEAGWQYYIERPLVQKLFFGFQKVSKQRFFPLSKGQKRIAKRVAESNIDMVYCRCFDVVPELVRQKVPVVFESHNLKISPQRPIVKQILALADSEYLGGLVVLSKPVKAVWESFGFPAHKIHVMPTGVNLLRYAPDQLEGKRSSIRASLGWTEQDYVAAYTGHLYRGRGMEYILEAARQTPEIKYLIVGGRPDDVAYYQEMGKELANVHFTGLVPNGEVPAFTEAADVLLMPYTRDTPTWRQMSPVKLYEYMAAGRPIISTDLPPLLEALDAEEEALFVPEKDGKALVEAILRLQAEPELARKLSENNLVSVTKHSLAARAQRIVEIGLGR
ncbi:MAG: glycosyltransferase family 4 protein [Bacteroidia bacterium]